MIGYVRLYSTNILGWHVHMAPMHSQAGVEYTVLEAPTHDEDPTGNL